VRRAVAIDAEGPETVAPGRRAKRYATFCIMLWSPDRMYLRRLRAALSALPDRPRTLVAPTTRANAEVASPRRAGWRHERRAHPPSPRAQRPSRAESSAATPGRRSRNAMLVTARPAETEHFDQRVPRCHGPSAPPLARPPSPEGDDSGITPHPLLQLQSNPSPATCPAPTPTKSITKAHPGPSSRPRRHPRTSLGPSRPHPLGRPAAIINIAKTTGSPAPEPATIPAEDPPANAALPLRSGRLRDPGPTESNAPNTQGRGT